MKNTNITAASTLEDPLLTRSEVVAALQISRVLLWRLIKDGKFPSPIKIGDAERWRRSTIERHLAALEQGAA